MYQKLEDIDKKEFKKVMSILSQFTESEIHRLAIHYLTKALNQIETANKIIKHWEAGNKDHLGLRLRPWVKNRKLITFYHEYILYAFIGLQKQPKNAAHLYYFEVEYTSWCTNVTQLATIVKSSPLLKYRSKEDILQEDRSIIFI